MTETMYKVGYWFDGCEHPKESYVGSFSINTRKFDIYLYDDNGKEKVCVRFGNEHHEYLSLGDLKMVCSVAETYPDSLEWVTTYGIILDYKYRRDFV